jgi:4-hydroxy-3-polyprenylbenzoate decarboxylase
MRLCGDTLIVDARSKRPGYGDNPPRFPNVVTSHPDTIEHVDARWTEYGLGKLVESPSRRYRRLWLSDEAQW